MEIVTEALYVSIMSVLELAESMGTVNSEEDVNRLHGHCAELRALMEVEV